MTTGTDYATLYRKAYTAYGQGKMEEAAMLVESMDKEFPDDANILLLQGHICLNQQQYALARSCYESVMKLADAEDVRDCAQKGLEQLQEVEALNYVSEAEASVEAPITIPAETDSSTVNSDDHKPNPEDRDDDELLTDAQVSDSDDKNTSENLANYSENINLDQSPQKIDNLASNEDEEIVTGFKETLQLNSDLSDISGSDSTAINKIDEATSLTAPLSDWDLEISDLELSSEKRTSTTDDDNFFDELEFTTEEMAEIAQFDLDDDVSISSELASSELAQLSADALSEKFVAGNLDVPILDSDAPSSAESLDFADYSSAIVKPTVDGKQGWLRRFNNASLRQKHGMIAVAAGLIPVFVITIIGFISSVTTPKVNDPVPGQKNSQTAEVAASESSFFPFGNFGLMLLAAGSSFLTVLLLGQLMATQTRRSLTELQTQFTAIEAGNLQVRANVYSEDETGQLAAGFNQFWQKIASTTGQAEHRASEMAQAKEELQRQVIHLLDDVEGAAKGDLTVEAKVSADILGAVADAFNLTIQNLRDILRQVKQAARQVNQGATDSAAFARNNSSESLRMAEELAVTLQSVQMMNDSIQRVAENAGTAENVARKASLTALKGGEAVERTVTGVLGIRETVSNTARKVKRLAEASQEISKIVAVISQISSRTNLLALNASLQAARAGEAGRGFAVVAEEVRQLADRSAKSLKEIERIVSQIQGETGSVMTAMEEGIQQVLDVAEKSEQAKRGLDEIIYVSNHIDQLVQSITADTVQQKENSQAVAHVMQSVEMTAQATSHESQRVAGSLQKLVAISRDLLSSVEKFRIDA